MPASHNENAGFRTFVKTGPDGERLERAVHSAADEVSANFDGYFPEPAPQPAKPDPQPTRKPAGTSTPASS